jgi:nucleotide-binding universal stress UspA family protein
MLRSLIVAVDGSPSSKAAAQVAFALGRRFNAQVEGLGVIDSAWIRRPQPVPAGALAYKRDLEAKELRSETARIEAALLEFWEQAREAKVRPFAARQVEGEPLRLIAAEATTHDMVVVGHHSLVHVEGELYDLPVCIERIVRDEPRPVLVVPNGWSRSGQDDAPGPVLVAFDGSPASSRALHMVALLGLVEDRVVHVVTLDEASQVQAEETARRACSLLQRHGAAETRAIGLGDKEAGTPAETILGLAKALKPEMIVMGAFGRRGMREIFGSCTQSVLTACPTPLFLHH